MSNTEVEPFWILCHSRTGSQFLMSMLNNTKLFNPKIIEHFHQKQFNDGCYKNVKIPKYANVKRCLYKANFKDQYKNKIKKLYPNIKFIHLRRKNIIDSVISNYLSNSSKIFITKNYNKLKEFQNTKIPYDEKKILDMYLSSLRLFDSWTNFLHGEKCYEIFYEDLKADPERIFFEVIDFLKIKPSKELYNPQGTLIQSHPLKEEFKRRFRKFLDKNNPI